MSPWLFNVYMDGVVREVNAKAQGNGIEMVDWNGREWAINQLLFAADTALVANSEEKLSTLIRTFGSECEKRKFKVNAGKSKVMRCTRNQNAGNLNITLNGQMLEEVKVFKYLGSQASYDGRVEKEVCQRVKEASKCLGGMKSIMSNRYMSMNIKRKLYEAVIVPTVLYGAETWNVSEPDKKKLNVFEMRCLRRMVGVARRDRVRNQSIRYRTGITEKLSSRVEKKVLGWFGHMERMNWGRLTSRVWRSRVRGANARGRPRTRWMNGVANGLHGRGMSVEQGKAWAQDRGSWKAIVKGQQ